MSSIGVDTAALKEGSWEISVPDAMGSAIVLVSLSEAVTVFAEAATSVEWLLLFVPIIVSNDDASLPFIVGGIIVALLSVLPSVTDCVMLRELFALLWALDVRVLIVEIVFVVGKSCDETGVVGIAIMESSTPLDVKWNLMSSVDRTNFDAALKKGESEGQRESSLMALL
ncbi:hypothetical protein CCR75_004198 [Bremia lactucae]|uniref:Uncharacterized protein n=1 Tax=Bremia lactucae TaxID=4779 RepID=A0A976IE03_BRELC|nr:hypothetical protein CCR75_004198 [Bremia lactucae]